MFKLIVFMVKIIEDNVKDFSIQIRLACFMLANVCDPKTMMPSLDGLPMDINKLATYFNLDKVRFSGLYSDLLKNNIIANIMTGGLDCYVLNPAYFSGFEDEQLSQLVDNIVFGTRNYTLVEKITQDVSQTDIQKLNKKMKQLRKLGYISV